jgi:UDP-3-O-[3-hydroxymyristoyl] glucosamine N-acyltransferase
MKQYTTEQINRAVNGTLDGSPTIMITGVEQISEATTNQLTFIGEKKYIKLWGQSRASAAIVNNILDVEPGKNRALFRVTDADIAMALVLQLFEPEPPKCEPGIDSTAVVDPTAVDSHGLTPVVLS